MHAGAGASLQRLLLPPPLTRLRSAAPLLATPQETQFFTKFGSCAHPDEEVKWGCDPAATQRYIAGSLHLDAVLSARLGRAAFDASTGYSWAR